MQHVRDQLGKFRLGVAANSDMHVLEFCFCNRSGWEDEMILGMARLVIT
jgi:hypothetical protein